VSFYYNRGIALQNQHQIDAAIKDFSDALKIFPDFYKANISRAVALLEKGDLDGAIADYTHAIQFEPNDASLYYGRGATRQKKNDLEGALADYTKTIELDQRHALAYANRGVVKVLLKQSDYAADFETAFRLDPSLKASYMKFYENRRRPG
jgi:Flp pilus assembly protein TadD